MWQFVILTASRVGGPPHDPWPVLFWALVMIGFLAVVAGAAHIANHVDDRRHGSPDARATDHGPDVPGP